MLLILGGTNGVVRPARGFWQSHRQESRQDEKCLFLPTFLNPERGRSGTDYLALSAAQISIRVERSEFVLLLFDTACYPSTVPGVCSNETQPCGAIN